MRVRIPPTPRKTARRRDGKRALAYPDRGPSGPRPLPEFGVIGRRLNSQALRGDVSDNGTYRSVAIAVGTSGGRLDHPLRVSSGGRSALSIWAWRAGP